MSGAKKLAYGIRLTAEVQLRLREAAELLSTRGAPARVGPRTLAAQLIEDGVKRILDAHE